MAMPQRDRGIQATAGGEEGRRGKKKAEARARVAYRRKQRQGAWYRSQRCPPTSKGRERGTDRNAARRPAGTGEKGMGENPAPVQASRTVAVSGCGEGVNVV